MKTIALILALCAFPACDTTDHAAANQSAKEFMSNIPGATGVQCADQDTDNDGYVSCTIFRGSADPLPIQCGSQKYCINCSRGCKYIPFKGR